MRDIDPKKTYSLREVLLLGVMGNTHSTVNRRILRDMAGENILKARIVGSDLAPRYRVLGKNLIRYIGKMKI